MIKQPNPLYRTPSDLPSVHREHYEVAKQLNGIFGALEFREQYQCMFPGRPPGSILPSDYCFGRDNEGNLRHPRFLLWNGSVGYVFVGLDGRYDRHAQIEPTSTRSNFGIRGFGRSRPFHLDPAVAEEAVRRFNADDKVMGQEMRVLEALPDGLLRSQLRQQLRAIARAYSTRTSNHDIDVIANAIKRGWDEWEALISKLADLEHQVPDASTIRGLIGYFLSQKTEKKPRSFATKVLHFARPRAFVSVDGFAANLLSNEIGSPCWSTTANLGTDEMANWYEAYLETLHAIGEDNRDLIAELIELDASEATDPRFDRLRGLPKMVDKVLWWCGRERKQKRLVQAFQAS